MQKGFHQPYVTSRLCAQKRSQTSQQPLRAVWRPWWCYRTTWDILDKIPPVRSSFLLVLALEFPTGRLTIKNNLVSILVPRNKKLFFLYEPFNHTILRISWKLLVVKSFAGFANNFFSISIFTSLVISV